MMILFSISSFAQNIFNYDKNEANLWYRNKISSAAEIRSKTKEIDFLSHHYAVKGIVSKNMLVSQQIVHIYDYDSDKNQRIILQGKVSYDKNKFVVEGIRHNYTDSGIARTYGSFYVSNTDNGAMTLKVKEAKNLTITDKEIRYYMGYYRSTPIIYRLGHDPHIYIYSDKDGEEGDAWFSAPVPSSVVKTIRYNDLSKILLGVKSAFMRYGNGSHFDGNVRPIMKEDKSIDFIRLEGTLNTFSAYNRYRHISMAKKDGYLQLTLDSPLDYDSPLLGETYFIPDDGTIREEEYWDTYKYFKNFEMMKLTYRNGNSFYGKGIFIEGQDMFEVPVKATQGTFEYANGDKFIGNVNGNTSGPFFIDGVTIFKDGSEYKGDWLENIRLTQELWEKVLENQYPSDALVTAIKLQQKFQYKLQYKDYYMKKSYNREQGYYHHFYYFKPTDVCWGSPSIRAKHIRLNKKNGRYEFLDPENDDAIILEVLVDESGKHIEEIVYDKNQKTGEYEPTYINQFGYYTNGVCKTIKSYSYTSKKAIFLCSFFSNGELENAYQYALGNNDRWILRRYKEYDKSWDTHHSYLYDLDGNFEKTINWCVGIDIPRKLDLNDFDLIDPLQ